MSGTYYYYQVLTNLPICNLFFCYSLQLIFLIFFGNGISLGLKEAWPWWKPAPWSLALIISIPSSESLSWWCWGLPGWLMRLSRLIDFVLTHKFEHRVHCQVSEVEVSNTESLAFSEQWERKLDWICQLEERLASELRYWLVPV